MVNLPEVGIRNKCQRECERNQSNALKREEEKQVRKYGLLALYTELHGVDQEIGSSTGLPLRSKWMGKDGALTTVVRDH